MNDKILGIDLGTTHSAVAVVDAGFPLILADREGHRLTPSVVHYPTGGGEPKVGYEALRMRSTAPKRTVYDVKRFMGRRTTDLNEEERNIGYELSLDPGSPIEVLIGESSVRPESVSAAVLAHLKRVAESAMESSLDRAVITVPAYFNDAQRQATLEAGRQAGLQVERILHEPTAAALAYGLHRLKESSRIAVYDLGGGTFDITILEMVDGVFRVLATHGHTRLGGHDIDQSIVEHFLEQEELRKSKEELLQSPEAMAKLRAAAEQAKKTLSQELEAWIEIPFLTPSLHMRFSFRRETLEKLAAPWIDRTRECCLRALHDAHLESQELDQVVLVGGQTRMPMIRERVSAFFQCSDFEETRGNIRLGQDFHAQKGPALNVGQHPDEAIALGAAIQGAMLSGSLEHMTLLDVTPLSLGLETFGGLMNVLIPRNSTIPLKAGEVFTTAVDNQRKILIHVLQGEREKASDNWSLGRFVVPFEPSPKGVPRVGVQFEIDANGILHVLARNLHTGEEQVLEIQSAIDVTDQQVTEMVESSLEHALEDMDSRHWIEQKLKADQLTQAAQSSLMHASGLITTEEREVIEQKISLIRQVIGSENTESRTGDTNRLKQSIQELDEATQELAAGLMQEMAAKLNHLP